MVTPRDRTTLGLDHTQHKEFPMELSRMLAGD
jgi:hypothetical protein